MLCGGNGTAVLAKLLTRIDNVCALYEPCSALVRTSLRPIRSARQVYSTLEHCAEAINNRNEVDARRSPQDLSVPTRLDRCRSRLSNNFFHYLLLKLQLLLRLLVQVSISLVKYNHTTDQRLEIQ